MMTYEESTSTDTYALGRTSQETRRLQTQANFMNPWTLRLLQEAHIQPGMKVLDVGSGAGDVALLLADLVGPQGTVIGIDMNPTVLETARARLHEAGFANATFLVGNIETFPFEGEFDAIVGRLILAHLREPLQALHHLERYLRPGGLMAFQEPDFSRSLVSTSYPPCALWDQACHWADEAFRAAGVAITRGLDLYQAFRDIGLRDPHLSSDVLFGAGPDWIGYLAYAETIRSLLPLILKFGVATEEEVAIDTLSQRMREEALSRRSVLRGPEMISIWAQKASPGF